MKRCITLTALVSLLLSLAVVFSVQDDEELSRLMKQLEARTRPDELGKVYAYYMDRGKIAELQKRFEERAKRGDGAALLILGMIHQKGGHDAEALTLLAQAEQKRPNDYWAAKMHGSALLRVGQRAEAIEALKRALSNKPTRVELLATAGELTRLYQRAGQTDQARQMWQKIEEQLQDRVSREKIATLFAEEKLFADALKRFEALLADESAPTRRIALRMQIAELKSKLNRIPDARIDYESLVADLADNDHRYREVRRRIENLILTGDNKDILEDYYRKVLAKQPDDFFAYTRLIRLAIDRGSVAEALKLLDNGLSKAPANPLLRKQKIDLLEQEGRFAEAVAACESYDKAVPNSPDLYVRWGQLVVRSGVPTKEAAQKAALDIWKRLLPAEDKPDSVSVLGRVADLCRQASMPSEALELYHRAVKAAPNDPTPREALGEYLHTLNRPEEARTAWMGLVEGSRRTPENLAHLADVLADYHRIQDAVSVIKQACELKPNDFTLHSRWITLLQTAGKQEEALNVSQTLQRLAGTADEKNRALEVRLRLLRETSKLASEIVRLQQETTAKPQALNLYLLARHFEEDRKWQEAQSTLEKALALETELSQHELMIPAYTTAARIAENSGDLEAAGVATRKLSEKDPKNRITHLRKVAKLEATRGRSKEALAAAQLVVQDAPTDPSRYRFLSEIAFNMGLVPEGLAALQTAVRVAPNDPDALNALSDALSERFQPAEALEITWRSFDLAPPERKPAIARKLADVARRLDRSDSIVQDIERRLSPSDTTTTSLVDSTEQRRIVALCCAQAEVALSRLPAARKRLENLLAEQPDDGDLLGQLVDLAEKDGDLQAALLYQRQRYIVVRELAQKKLTELLLEAGEIEEAVTLWSSKYKSSKDATRQLEFIDNLLFFNRYDEVLALLTPALRDHPTDWELLYRRGLAEERTGKAANARQTFESLLALRHSDDQLSKLQEQSSPQKKEDTELEDIMVDRVMSAEKIRATLGLSSARNDSESGEKRKELWTPADFGQARMAALGWLSTLAGREGRSDAFMAELKKASDAAQPEDYRSSMDIWYLSWVLRDQAIRFQVTPRLLRTNMHAILFYFLNELQERGTHQSTALTSQHLDQAIQAYQYLLAHRRDWISTRSFSPLAKELSFAGREAERDQIYLQTIKTLSKDREIAEGISIAAEKQDSKEIIRLLNVLDDKPRVWKEFLKSDPSSNINTYVAQMVKKDSSEEALRTLTAYFDANAQRWLGSRYDRTPLKSEELQPLGTITHPSSEINVQMEITHPVPNRFLTNGALNTLAVTYLIFKHQGLEDDLIEWARARLKKTTKETMPLEHQLLAALLWWRDQREASAQELEQACKLLPQDLELGLTYASVLSLLSRPEQGIAVLDRYAPVTPEERKKKLWAVLDYAIRSNSRQRAAQAAETLSELRLSPEDEARLCVELARADKPELATRSLERLRLASAGKPELMLRGMRLARDRGQNQMAIDIAYSILRAIPQPVAPNRNARRDEALRVLHQLGRLQPLISRAEAYRKASPQSKTVYNELSEYYRAVNNLAKAREVAVIAVSQRKSDLNALIELANQLRDDGRTKDAVPYYLAALKLQPYLFYSQTYYLIQTFQDAGALPELANALLAVDQKSIDLNDAESLIEALWKDKRHHALAVKLLARAWPAGMASASTLERFLRTGTNESRWNEPGVYELAYARLITDPLPESAGAWAGIGGLLQPFLEAAIERKQLAVIREHVLKNCEERKWWKAGLFLRAWIQHLEGNDREAQINLQQLLTASSWEGIPTETQEFIIRELSKDESLSKMLYPLVRQEFQKLLREKDAKRFTAAKANLYLKLATLENDLPSAQKNLIDGYKLLPMEISRFTMITDNSQRTEYVDIASRQREELLPYLLKAGRPFETMILASETVDFLMKAKPASSDSSKRFNSQYRAAMRAIQADVECGSLSAELANHCGQPARLDYVDENESDLSIRSALFDAVSSVRQPQAREAVRKKLHDLAVAQPSSLAPRLLQTALSLSNEKVEDVSQLVDWMKSHPLDVIPAGRQPSAQNRRQATEQAAYWFLAAQCLKRDDLRTLGREFAARALTASERLPDQRLAQIIARQWANLESKNSGSSSTGHWKKLIDLILASSTTAQGKVPLSLTNVEAAFQLAEELTKSGQAPLSVELINRVFAAGRPRPDAGRDSQTMDSLCYQMLVRLETIWRQAGVPSLDVYRCVRDIVLPPQQKEKVYDDGTVDIIQGNKTTGMMLVALALESGQTEELKKILIEREGHVATSKDARGILIHLCKRTDDIELSRRLLNKAIVEINQQAEAYNVVTVMYESSAYLSHPELGKLSREILRKGSENYRAGQATALDDNMMYALSKSYLQAGDLNAAQRGFAEYVDAGDSVRRSAQYRRTKAMTVARTWADHNQSKLAWEAFAMAVDLPTTSKQSSDDALVLASFAQLLRSGSPIERYQQLKSWTFPSGGNPRFSSGFFESSTFPLQFNQPRLQGYVNTFDWLMDAAQEASQLKDLTGTLSTIVSEKETPQLKDLTGTLSTLVTQKVDRAWPMLMAVQARTRQTEGLAATYEQWKQHRGIVKGPEQESKPFPVSANHILRQLDYIAARECMRLNPAGRQSSDFLQAFNGEKESEDFVFYSDSLDSQFDAKMAVEVSSLQQQGIPSVKNDIEAQLTHWLTSGGGEAFSFVEGHLYSPRMINQARLAWPLQGDFELSFDSYYSLSVSYGGCTFRLQDVAGSYNRGFGARHDPNFWKRCVLKSLAGRVTLILDNREVFPWKQVSASSPFLSITPGQSGASLLLRNIKLTGQPKIPKSIDLLQHELKWTKETVKALRPEYVSRFGRSRSPALLPVPWKLTKENELICSRVLSDQVRVEHLTYDAIAPGESISYEFYYEPGKAMMHPEWGNLAFVLTPSEVRLHWRLARTAPGLELGPGKTVSSPPSERRGNGPLPLKQSAWNTLRMEFRGTSLALVLNDQLIYDHKHDPCQSNVFGLCCMAEQEQGRVRNVRLQGPWPGAIPESLLATSKQLSSNQIKQMRTRLKEDILEDNFENFDKSLKALPEDDRLNKLQNWVFPDNERTTYRLSGALIDDSIISPADDLLDLAIKFKRLETVKGPSKGRPLAWEAMWELAAGQIDQARLHLLELAQWKKPELEKALWPVFLAARRGLSNAATREVSLQLLGALAKLYDVKPPPRHLPFVLKDEIAKSHARATLPVKAQAWIDPEMERSKPNRKQAEGTWYRLDDVLFLLDGSPETTLNYPFPLSGDFSMNFHCQLKDGISIKYGGVTLYAEAQAKKLFRGTTSESLRPILLDPPVTLANQDSWLEISVSVQKETLKIAFGNRTIISQQLPANHQPWLSFTGRKLSLKGFRLSKTPSPLAGPLDMTANYDLTGWQGSDWNRQGMDVVLTPSEYGFASETALRYERLLPLRSVIEYEFYYQKGQSALVPKVGDKTLNLVELGAKAIRNGQWNTVRMELTPEGYLVQLNGNTLPLIPEKINGGQPFSLVLPAPVQEGRFRSVKLTAPWKTPVAGQEVFAGKN